MRTDILRWYYNTLLTPAQMARKLHCTEAFVQEFLHRNIPPGDWGWRERWQDCVKQEGGHRHGDEE